MKRRLWITAMSFAILSLASSGAEAQPRVADSCLVGGSTCQDGPDCCSKKCLCGNEDCLCSG
jgi:hypothetical protein